MISRRYLHCLAACIGLAASTLGLGCATLSPTISADDARIHVNQLASDRMDGRMTGTKGAELAADYLVGEFKRIGLMPGGDDGSYKQAFEFHGGNSDNVIGFLPPAGDCEEYILIGAHYDHIGHGEIGSLADKSEAGQIHNGADDNASGVSVVLELANYYAAQRKDQASNQQQERGLIFACWSGEEIGIIGSTHYANHPLVPWENTVAYFNFDMVGHVRDHKLVLQGVASSPDWRRWIEKRNIPAGFNLILEDDPYQPTDTSAIYPKGVPVLGFFTGAHEFYNKPSDDPETLDYAGIERVANFARSLIDSVEASTVQLAYATVEMKPKTSGGGRRVSTGTIPDYAAGVAEGMAISGVKAEGPADKAGLKSGDVILELGGKKVGNIQDYSNILGELKPDVTVDIVILRDGERMTLQITPVGTSS